MRICLLHKWASSHVEGLSKTPRHCFLLRERDLWAPLPPADVVSLLDLLIGRLLACALAAQTSGFENHKTRGGVSSFDTFLMVIGHSHFGIAPLTEKPNQLNSNRTPMGSTNMPADHVDWDEKLHSPCNCECQMNSKCINCLVDSAQITRTCFNIECWWSKVTWSVLRRCNFQSLLTVEPQSPTQF